MSQEHFPSQPENRVDIIKKLEASGVPLGLALRALIEEAQYAIGIRLGDLNNSKFDHRIDEGSEAAVIERIVEFGFDPHNSEQLDEARETLLTLDIILLDTIIDTQSTEDTI